MKMPNLSEFAGIMVICLVLFLGALILTSFWEDDIEVKDNYVYGRELVHEHVIKFVDPNIGEDWEIVDVDIVELEIDEPNDLSELEIQCACGWITKVTGKEISYRQYNSIVTERQ